MAAYAFAAAFNRVAILSAQHQVPDGEYERQARAGRTAARSKGAYTQAARDCYRDGLARGLEEMVKKQLAESKRAEEQKLERARLSASAGEAWQSSGSDDDDGGGGGGGGGGGAGGGGDSDDEEDGQGPGHGEEAGGGCGGARTDEAAEAKKEEDEKEEEPPKRAEAAGESAEAAVARLERKQSLQTALVMHTERIADQVLKEAGIKVHKGPAYKRAEYHHASYQKGREDAKLIDLSQRALGGGGSA